MAVREYIGARYVPVFANPVDWNSTRTYEPLTIVTYQGNSYTSRQYVPSGIQITNSDYWILTSNYNSQVEAYRQEVQRLSDKVDNFDLDISGETQARTDADTALQGEIDALDERVTDLEYTQCILIGDSWCATGTGRLLAARIKNRLGIATNRWFNKARSSTGFLKPSPEPTFPQQLANAIADDNVNKQIPTIIIVIGGTNDFGAGYTTASEYASVINSMQDSINAAFVKQKTVFFFMQCGTPRQYPYTLIKQVQTLTASKCNVVNAFWPVSRKNFADTAHLNSDGEIAFARFVLANLGYGTYDSVTDIQSFKTEAETVFGTGIFGTCQIRQTWTENTITSWIYVSFAAAKSANAINGAIREGGSNPTGLQFNCPINLSERTGAAFSTADANPLTFSLGYSSSGNPVNGDSITLRNFNAVGLNNYSGCVTEIITA